MRVEREGRSFEIVASSEFEEDPKAKEAIQQIAEWVKALNEDEAAALYEQHVAFQNSDVDDETPEWVEKVTAAIEVAGGADYEVDLIAV